MNSFISSAAKPFLNFAKGSPEVALSIFTLSLLGYLVYAASATKPQETVGFIAFIALCIVVALIAFGIIKTVFAHWERK